MAQIIMDKKRITIIAVVIFVFILFFSIKLYERSDKTEDIPDTIAE
jgi:transposase